MFIFINVKCNNCNNIFEVYKKNPLDDFVMIPCPKCKGCNVKRIWSISAVDIAQGKLGNSKKGYGTQMTYHPSSLTGKVKGKKIK
jgi:hypothetical protein